jgi:hypothetical protein
MHIFLSNYWWQRSDIWSQASYRYPISWEAFLDPSDSYFLFADFVDFYTHWIYMLIFRRIFLSNYWWQKSDIWSQASYRYPISWEAFFYIVIIMILILVSEFRAAADWHVINWWNHMVCMVFGDSRIVILENIVYLSIPNF